MGKRRAPAGGDGAPYGVLLGLGVAVLILIAVTLYYGLRGQPAAPPPGPERTAFWLAQAGQPAGERRDMILLLEEDRQQGALTVLVLPARLQVPSGPVALLPEPGGGRQAQRTLEQALGYRVHHYAVLGPPTMARLVDMTGGLSVDGQVLDGAGAVAYLFAEADVGRRMERAPGLLLGIMAAAGQGRFQAGLKDLIALAGGVETDISLLDLPAILGRWGGYVPGIALAPGEPRADGAWQLDLARLQQILRPDPPGQAARRPS